MTKNLSNEKLAELISEIGNAVEFYSQINTPATVRMADSLALTMVGLTELQERRAADASPAIEKTEFTCERCGTTTTHPEGWHYCHAGAKNVH